jgi:phosphatidylinositol alpha-mannosyltransferase
VSVSAAAAATAQQDFGLSTEVLFNGIDVARLRRSARHTPVETTIVTVGRLEERKGVATLIGAVLHHNEHQLDDLWQLDVVGAGPERQRLEVMAQGSDRIHFHGALDHERKNQLLRGASVVVCPALRGESFGIVLLEAMACEVPVVASDIEGYRQAAGGHCFLAIAGDPSALEGTITEALHAGSARTADAAAYASHWSMDALVDHYETLYQEAVEQFASR